MADLNPKTLLIVGSVLLLAGFILPVLMIIHIIDSTFFLNFLAFGASTLGLLIGMVGALSLAVRNRRRDR